MKPSSRYTCRLVLVAMCLLFFSPSALPVDPNHALAGAQNAGQEVPATSNYANNPLAHNSPVLAVDPHEPRFVALAHRVDGPDFSCALQISGDGGRSWVPARPLRRLPVDVDKCYAPEIAFGGDGALFYLFVGLAGPGNEPIGVFLTKSIDGGRTFSRPRKVLGPFSFGVRMAIDREASVRGRIHIIWIQANSDPGLGAMPPPPNPIFSIHSDDGGREFSKPVRVSDMESDLVAAPALALGPKGMVHVAYYDLQEDLRDYYGLAGPVWEGKWWLVVATSNNGGRSFTSGVVVDESVIPPERVMLIFTMPPPSLVVDSRGRVYLAWHDGRNGHWDVFLRTSNDGGRSWSLRRLNDDPVSSKKHQYLPRLSLSPTGRLDAIFYDRRRDPENQRNDVFYTFSVDAGQDFSRKQRLTTRNSHARIGQTYAGDAAKGMVEFGSRIALASFDDRVLAAWTDTRNSVQRVQQDIFSRLAQAPKRTSPFKSGSFGPAGS